MIEEPRLLDRLRNRIRLKHYSIRTEKAYLDWNRRFILFHNKKHPRTMGTQEVEQFLTYLAVNGRVASSTQNQALSAILFMYKEVLKIELSWLNNVTRAKRPEKVPLVFSKNEIQKLLANLDGTYWIMAHLLYGAGLRLMECLRLRVKDVDFDMSHIDSFAQILVAQGYKTSTAKHKIRIAADFSRWLDQQGFNVTDLDEITLNEFLLFRGRRGSIFNIEPPTLQDLLKHLRETGVAPDAVKVDDSSKRRRIECGFAEYLSKERGLEQITIDKDLRIARQFLSFQFGTGPIVLNNLHPKDIVRFILECTETGSAKHAQRVVCSLRSFFRFLFQRGKTAIDLSPSALTVANWRLSELPKFLEPEQVERLLHSCDQDTLIGQRDYVILLLLARLGLRAGDVVHMTLDDIDWEVGELIVCGKSNRQERLPLAQDVGEALVKYLCDGRPPCSSRRVFIRIRAPHKGFSSSVAICNIVRRSLKRAKLNPAFKGSHLLRHSLATQMLRGGASLAEIGEILRHQRLDTTQIYAKVDLAALSALAQPWPGGEI